MSTPPKLTVVPRPEMSNAQGLAFRDVVLCARHLGKVATRLGEGTADARLFVALAVGVAKVALDVAEEFGIELPSWVTQ